VITSVFNVSGFFCRRLGSFFGRNLVVETACSLADRLRLAPPVKQYRIGEVARYSGLSRQTVHNYTIMGLICESEWTPGGHRLYDEMVFEALVHIETLKQTHTLREIREMLSSVPGGAAGASAESA
jgi:hypothetical protein